MLSAITTFFVAMGAGWQPVGGQLLTSGVLLLCGHQDIRSSGRMGAGFWFFMALGFGVSATTAGRIVRLTVTGASGVSLPSA